MALPTSSLFFPRPAPEPDEVLPTSSSDDEEGRDSKKSDGETSDARIRLSGMNLSTKRKGVSSSRYPAPPSALLLKNLNSTTKKRRKDHPTHVIPSFAEEEEREAVMPGIAPVAPASSYEKEKENEDGDDSDEPLPEEIPCPFDDNESTYFDWHDCKYDNYFCYLCQYCSSSAQEGSETIDYVLKNLMLASFRECGALKACQDVRKLYNDQYRDVPDKDKNTTVRLDDWECPVIMRHFIHHKRDADIFKEWGLRTFQNSITLLGGKQLCQRNRFTGQKTLNGPNMDRFLKLWKTYETASKTTTSSNSGSSR